MTFSQIIRFLEKNLDPNTGNRISVINTDKEESLCLYIYGSKTLAGADYVFIFNKLKEKEEFSAKVMSGYSGIEYKLELDVFDNNIFGHLKHMFLMSDSKHMENIENLINSIEVEGDE